MATCESQAAGTYSWLQVRTYGERTMSMMTGTSGNRFDPSNGAQQCQHIVLITTCTLPVCSRQNANEQSRNGTSQLTRHQEFL